MKSECEPENKPDFIEPDEVIIKVGSFEIRPGDEGKNLHKIYIDGNEIPKVTGVYLNMDVLGNSVELHFMP